MKIKSNILIAIIVVMVGTMKVFAGGGIWLDQDPCDHLWSSLANWENGLPTASDNVVIHLWDPSIGMPVVENSGAVATTVYISNNSFGTDGELTVNNGSLSVSHIKIASGGEATGNTGTLHINGGTTTISDHVVVGEDGGNGVLNISGGTLETMSFLAPKDWGGTGDPSGTARINLYGGQLAATAFFLEHGCYVNITGGRIVLVGDQTDVIQSHVDAGIILGYGGMGTVHMDYDNTNPGKTTVWAGLRSSVMDFDVSGLVDAADLNELIKKWLDDTSI